MSGPEGVDVVIVVALLWVGWRVLQTPALFSAVVLFIVFGLLMALGWVRLAAPDIALAEAAIGAGLTGVLLLDAVAHLEAQRERRQRRALGAMLRTAAVVLTLALGGVLAFVAVSLPPTTADLPQQVAAALPASGVSHPVTAVLLNFRGYDTLLEIGVLLLAVFGILALRPSGAPAGPAAMSAPLAALVHAVVPLMVLVAGYLWWAGSHRPGGAFQAGAVLGSAVVLLRLSGQIPALLEPSAPWRLGLILGFAVFLGIAAAALSQGALLEYAPAWAGALILAIEAALTLSIALVLFALFAAAPPYADRSGAP